LLVLFLYDITFNNHVVKQLAHIATDDAILRKYEVIFAKAEYFNNLLNAFITADLRSSLSVAFINIFIACLYKLGLWIIGLFAHASDVANNAQNISCITLSSALYKSAIANCFVVQSGIVISYFFFLFQSYNHNNHKTLFLPDHVDE
jgi:hypothetical protein